MDEANAIAQFLGVSVKEVLQHAGVAIDLDGQPTRILLTSTIDEKAHLHRLHTPTPLPQAIVDRAQAAVGRRNDRIIAAQIRATTGPLAVLDDAVVLFAPTDIVEPAAIGSLAVCRKKDGEQVFVKVLRARKTGEALVQCAAGKTLECVLVTATPVLAILP